MIRLSASVPAVNSLVMRADLSCGLSVVRSALFVRFSMNVESSTEVTLGFCGPVILLGGCVTGCVVAVWW